MTASTSQFSSSSLPVLYQLDRESVQCAILDKYCCCSEISYSLPASLFLGCDILMFVGTEFCTSGFTEL